MNDSDEPTFTCPACTKRFRWKPQLVGQKVQCTCGHVFTVPSVGSPATKPPPPLPQDRQPVRPQQTIAHPSNPNFEMDFPTELTPGLNAPPAPTAKPAQRAGPPRPTVGNLADDAQPAEPPAPTPVKCPSCNLPMKPGAAVCLNCGYNVREGRRIQTQVTKAGEPPRGRPGNAWADAAAPAAAPIGADEDQWQPTRRRSPITEALARREDDATASRFKDLYLPIFFVVVGTLLTWWRVVASGVESPVLHTLVTVGVYLVLMVPLLLGCVFLTAKLLGISFGPLSLALLKLAGIAIGPLALADLVMLYISIATLGTGWILGAIIYGFVTGIPLSMMFDLDLGETMITLVIFVVMRMFFNIVVLAFLLGLLFA